jgi:hypothetical protein
MMKATAHLQEFIAYLDCKDFLHTEKAGLKDGTRGATRSNQPLTTSPLLFDPHHSSGQIDF